MKNTKNIEITDELLNVIFNRAIGYLFAAGKTVPDSLILRKYTIEAVWCNGGDDDYYYISAENLTEDLEEVVKKRILQEEEQKRLEKIRREEQEKKSAIHAKEI